MNFIDQYEVDRWDAIRKRGKLLYIVRWMSYIILFMLFVRASIAIFNKKSLDIDDILSMLAVGLFMGLLISLIRWRILENKFRNKE
jgi:uncharacterized membrane protein YczE